MKFLNKLQIKYKIIFIIVVIATLSTISGNVINYFYEVNNSKLQLIANIKLQAQLISESCWVPMEFNYKREAGIVLKQLHTIPDINDGILFTSNDELFASYHKSDVFVDKMPGQLKNSEYFIEGNYLHLKQIVEGKDRVYGYLYLRSAINWDSIINRRIKVGTLVIGLTLVLVFILAFFMQKSISTPIVTLTNQMDLVAKNKDYTIQFPNNSKDEIGALYSGFNAMLSEINKAEIKLKSAFKSLKESELKWQFAIEGAGDGLWDWDIKKNKVFISPKWKSMLGYLIEEINNDAIQWEKLIHPDDYKRSLRELEMHFRSETEVYKKTSRCIFVLPAREA